MTTEQQTNKPIIWTISGSDCSGGAGIAADIKTGHALGVEVCHLITANTVQNSQKLVAVNPVFLSIIKQQAEILLSDKPPAVIKIGLLANSEQVNWLTDFIIHIKKQFSNLKVIFDPVGHASVGGKNDGRFSNLSIEQISPLLSQVDVITPNTDEAKFLTSHSSTKLREIAEYILKLGVNSVILKGGHQLNNNGVPQQCTDYCLHTLTDNDSSKMSQDETISYQLSSNKVSTSYSHGGGCTFASALAAFIAHGYLLRDAFTLTKAFINQGLSTHINQENYYGAFEQTGWPKSKKHFPAVSDTINQKHTDLPAFKTLNIEQRKLGLYPVIGCLNWLEKLLPLGMEIIQLRIKNQNNEQLSTIIKHAVVMAAEYPNTRLFINDYWQLAIKHGAYGVHIGQEDLAAADLKTIQQAGLRLGISTHGCYEFLLAQQLQPSYLAIGAIFPTKTKDMTGQIQGIKNLTETMLLRDDTPVVAIGGINLDRVKEVWNTGVDSIAVVTAITESKDIEVTIHSFKKLMS